MIILDDKKPLLFLGDIHGSWSDLFNILDIHSLSNISLISVGDVGIGFISKDKQERQLKLLDERFNKKNIDFFCIRGNHDDPSYFKGNYLCNNIKLLEDYTLCKYKDKLIQLIGGAISIDRTGRNSGTSYWSEEGVVFDRDKCKKVDILVTHTAPTICYPQKLNEMVYGWAREDAYLLEDLSSERAVMDEIFKICNPSIHLYGHFHTSKTEVINNCIHKLLDINEMWDYK
jgi:hypothetical protein